MATMGMPSRRPSRTAMASFLGSTTNMAPGSLAHVADAAQGAVEFDPLLAQFEPFLLGKQVDGAVVLDVVEVIQPVDALFDGLEIGQHAAQPAVVDVKHLAAVGFFVNGFPGLLFGAHKQHRLAVGHGVG